MSSKFVGSPLDHVTSFINVVYKNSGNHDRWLPKEANPFVVPQFKSGLVEGFQLATYVPVELREKVIVLQRDQSAGGIYRTLPTKECEDEIISVTPGLIEVHHPSPREEGQFGSNNRWTVWQSSEENLNRANRVDLVARFGKDGMVLRQLFVVTRDAGESYVTGEDDVWRGRLFWCEGKLIGIPQDVRWGAFKVFERIQENEAFCAMVSAMDIEEFTGTDFDLVVPLDEVPEPKGKVKFARVDWFRPPMGRRGMGMVLLHTGETIEIHGMDITDDDGTVKYLERNQLIAYSDWNFWREGKKKVVGVWTDLAALEARLEQKRKKKLERDRLRSQPVNDSAEPELDDSDEAERAALERYIHS